jgi:RNA polymerase sigma factor (sigma-70 family)
MAVQSPSRTDTLANEPQGGLQAIEEEGLAREVRDGSDRAFAALYRRYHRQLYRYCAAMLRHDADAQDALQSTFAAAFTALSRGRRDAPLRPWLFRIAHNEAVSIMRRRRPEDELSETLATPEALVPEQAEERDRLARLVADLRALPERQRSALVLRELSGLSHEEIAQALESSVGTAKQTIFEARRSLAEFEAGREMSCREVCRTISDRDRRMLRARKVRAHLRGCRSCAAFAEAIPARSAELRALAPVLPLPPASAALLSRTIDGGAAAGGPMGGGGAGAAGAGIAGKGLFGLAAAKSGAVALAVVTATVGATAVLAPRSGPHPGLVLRASARDSAHRVTQAGPRSASAPRLRPAAAARSRAGSTTSPRASATELAGTSPVRAGGVNRPSSRRTATHHSDSGSARGTGRSWSNQRGAQQSASSHGNGSGATRRPPRALGQAKRSTGGTGPAHSHRVTARGNGARLAAAERKSARDST